MVGSGHVVFETNSTRQCYSINVIIPVDEICADLSMEILNLFPTVLEGDGDIMVQPSKLTIVDSKQPQCGVYILYNLNLKYNSWLLCSFHL